MLYGINFAKLRTTKMIGIHSFFAAPKKSSIMSNCVTHHNCNVALAKSKNQRMGTINNKFETIALAFCVQCYY